MMNPVMSSGMVLIAVLVAAACVVVLLFVCICLLVQERDAFQTGETFHREACERWREDWFKLERLYSHEGRERDRLAALVSALRDEVERQHELRDTEKDGRIAMAGTANWYASCAAANAKNAEKAALAHIQALDGMTADRDFWHEEALQAEARLCIASPVIDRHATLSAKELRRAIENTRKALNGGE